MAEDASTTECRLTPPKPGTKDLGPCVQPLGLEAFGHLIANTDMHPGNLSFSMRGTTLGGLCPVYDMLPMFFAPRHGELPDEIYRPTAQRDAFPPSAVEAARALWERTLASSLLSDGFKRIAERQMAVLPGGRAR